MTGGPIVFLIDVDNTLLDNDEIQNATSCRMTCLPCSRVGDRSHSPRR
jgi:hypothetical protein